MIFPKIPEGINLNNPQRIWGARKDENSTTPEWVELSSDIGLKRKNH